MEERIPTYIATLVLAEQAEENQVVTSFKYFPANDEAGEEIRIFFSNGESTLVRVDDWRYTSPELFV